MHVKLWGTRGSLATPGPEMVRYGVLLQVLYVIAARF